MFFFSFKFYGVSINFYHLHISSFQPVKVGESTGIQRIGFLHKSLPTFKSYELISHLSLSLSLFFFHFSSFSLTPGSLRVPRRPACVVARCDWLNTRQVGLLHSFMFLPESNGGDARTRTSFYYYYYYCYYHYYTLFHSLARGGSMHNNDMCKPTLELQRFFAHMKHIFNIYV